jgi:hypothetical protein
MASHFGFKSADISPKDILRSRGLDEGGRVQEFIDSECLSLCDTKIPKDQNFLINSGIINTKIGSGFIKWNTKYARRLYYHPEYNFSESPERGAYWFERMKQQHGDKIRKGAAQIAGGKA